MADFSVISTDLLVVGAGPIGLELAISLKRAGVSYIHLEAQQIGYTISWWPRNTPFFSTTERIELAGVPIQNRAQERTTGEEYLVYLRSLVEQFDLRVQTYERVTHLERGSAGFWLTSITAAGPRHYHAQRVVLTTGDMHRPRRLNIPGEDLPHVSHYFGDVHPYFRRRLLVVGGRNSAAEAALRCWRAGAEVSISYRRAAFRGRSIKHWLLPDLQAQIELGLIGFYPLTVPLEITPTAVTLARLSEDGSPGSDIFQHPADFVLLLTGFEADMTLLEQAGVTLHGPTRAPLFDPVTMETDVPGLYVAGTAAAGQRQEGYTIFIENSHVHVGRIVQALTGQWPARLGTIPSRQYELELKDIEAN